MSKKASRILSLIFKRLNRPTFETVGVTRYRELLEKSTRVFESDPEVKKDRIHIDGIQAEWLTPSNWDQHTIICNVHGGGFIAGSISSHRDLASRIAKAARAKVLLFEYRLAPEHPFPAGFEDAKLVYDWLTCVFADSHCIHISGDSAGGGLALSLVSDLMTKDKPLPCSVVLLSPWADLECKNESYQTNQEKDFMLDHECCKKIARFYTDQPLNHPLISPINADYSRMPPSLIQVGSNEILLDDSKDLAQKILQAGGTVDLEVWDDMFHVWHYFAKYLSEARDAIQRIGQFVQSHSKIVSINPLDGQKIKDL